jgi:hypothetical protein
MGRIVTQVTLALREIPRETADARSFTDIAIANAGGCTWRAIGTEVAAPT